MHRFSHTHALLNFFNNLNTILRFYRLPLTDSLSSFSVLEEHAHLSAQTLFHLLQAKVVGVGDSLTINKDLIVTCYYAGMYIPLGGGLAVGAFKNSFGDANAFFRRDVFIELGLAAVCLCFMAMSRPRAENTDRFLQLVFICVGGWPEEEFYSLHDWELLSRAVNAGYRLQVVPYSLYWYRTDAGSLIRNQNSFSLR